MLHRDGHVVWVYDEARVVRDADGKVRYSHGVMLDITGRKHTDDQVAFRTYHDELTGLPSREMFEELVELSVARARRHDGAVAVLCVDLVDFRLVNDSLGHRGRRRAAGRGRRPASRGDARDRPRRAARRGPVPAAARRPGPRRIRPRRRGAPRRVRRAADPRVASPSRSGSTRPRSTSAPASGSACSHATRTMPSRRCSATPSPRCSRRSGPGGTELRALRRRRGGLGRAAAVRDASAQGRRRPALDPLLPAGDRPAGRRHGRRRGADPVDRARRDDRSRRTTSSPSPRSSG